MSEMEKGYRQVFCYGDNSKYNYLCKILNRPIKKVILESRLEERTICAQYGLDDSYQEQNNMVSSSDMPSGVMLVVPAFNTVLPKDRGDVLVFSSYPYDKQDIWDLVDNLQQGRGIHEIKIVFYYEDLEHAATDIKIKNSRGDILSAQKHADNIGIEYCVFNPERDHPLSVLYISPSYTIRAKSNFNRWFERTKGKIKKFADAYSNACKMGEIYSIELLEQTGETDRNDESLLKWNQIMGKVPVFDVLCKRYKKEVLPLVVDAINELCDIGFDDIDKKFFDEIKEEIFSSYDDFFKRDDIYFDDVAPTKDDYRFNDYNPKFKKAISRYINEELQRILEEFFCNKCDVIKKQLKG